MAPKNTPECLGCCFSLLSILSLPSNDTGMAVGKDQLHIRLPSDIIARIDSDVAEGKATNRSDWIYRACLLYMFGENMVYQANREFRRMVYSDEFQAYIQKIIAADDERKEAREDQG